MENNYGYRVGDMIEVEYIVGEKAKGRILKLNSKENKADVEIAVVSRRNNKIFKDKIEIPLDKIIPIVIR